jgi:glycosyltransferase involved in cell wall biosynthesis
MAIRAFLMGKAYNGSELNMNKSKQASQTLWVQGWTGINHSYAMVNQYQLLELAKNTSINLRYLELAVHDGRWSKENIGAGFSPEEQQWLANLKPRQDEAVDAIYRIHTPNTLAQADCKVITFLVTEFGLDDKCFVSGVDFKSYVANGNLIATPSNWSRDRIVEYGFDAESVFVVPHGVDREKFKPFLPWERVKARTELGYGSDDVVFLNVGGPIWNKGLDLVLEAFFAVRQKHKNARLLIKDQQALYGISAVTMIQKLVTDGKITLDNDDIASIRIIPKTLSIEQLRQLYGIADYYVSPYRGEGFNLPVIEAIACGIKVIVTDGGSTDDFCDEHTSIKIPSIKLRNTTVYGHFVGAYLDPDLDALVQIMGRCSSAKINDSDSLKFGRIDMLEMFTWKRAAELMLALGQTRF